MSNKLPRGVLAGMAAFFIWGLFPLFWGQLGTGSCGVP
jgi:EamA domain-containing membrane protein RarD